MKRLRDHLFLFVLFGCLPQCVASSPAAEPSARADAEHPDRVVRPGVPQGKVTSAV